MKKLKHYLPLLVLAVGVLLSFLSKKPEHVIYATASTAFMDSRRKAYLNAVAALEADGQYIVNNERKAMANNKKNIRVAQSYVCSEIPVTSSSNSYVLNLIDQNYNVGNNNLLPGEVRIKQQDVFFTYAVGFYIRATVGGWQGMPNLLQTFPTPSLQGALPSLFPDLATVIGLWTNGRLSVSVNGDVLTPAWDLSQHLTINQTEVNVSGIGLNPYFNQTALGEDGQVICEPNWIVNGGNNNLYQITYPNNSANIYSGVNVGCTTQINLVLKLYGFLAQNASSIMNNAPLKQQA